MWVDIELVIDGSVLLVLGIDECGQLSDCIRTIGGTDNLVESLDFSGVCQS